ncbi:MAG: bifunctional adenosylcobinamide kinase/adenosylcobinamide-phosphate guanylyltransferase [Thioalkalispiraceae bacterium]|jgi:adenosylcobinamide kinase/adenosylcobinamide-phosphate guanylyltransferase
MLELVLGGARSGKSAYAEQCARHFIENSTNTKTNVLYIATATAGDEEMEARIRHHKSTRPANWQTIEEPVELARVLKQYDETTGLIIVDCLTLWLTNLFAVTDQQRRAAVDALLETLPALQTSVILVSNEIGMGVVPLGEQTRRFIDEAGRLHQALASCCQRVTLLVAGIPHRIKEETSR